MKVLVTGFFDLLHPGHIEFLKEAAKYGDLYVSIGNDKNMMMQKNKKPIYTEEQRLKMILALSCVKDASIAESISHYDWEEALIRLKPDMFLINDDGDTEEKRKLCEKYGVDYKVIMIRDEDDWSSSKVRKFLNDRYAI